MAKLLSTREILKERTWFQEIQPSSFYSEEDLERAVILNLENLFPEFVAIPFKKSLTNNLNGRKNKPDLAMIKSDYSEWYIIEVELGHHTVKHVREQVETFYHSNLDESYATYMHGKRPDGLDLNALITMVEERPPRLMVIINEHNEEIKASISSYSCLMCVFQIFLDNLNNPIYRLNGQHPEVYTSFCHCRLTKDIPYTIEILDVDFCNTYGIEDNSEHQISYNDKLSKWKRVDDSNRVFLICSSRNFPLDPSTQRYMLSYNTNNQKFKFSIA